MATDVGVLQRDPMIVDVDKSLAALDQFMENIEDRIEIEKTWLSSSGIDLVAVDAPFMPCRAAKELNIPAAIVR